MGKSCCTCQDYKEGDFTADTQTRKMDPLEPRSRSRASNISKMSRKTDANGSASKAFNGKQLEIMGAKHNNEHVIKTIELLGAFNWNLVI